MCVKTKNLLPEAWYDGIVKWAQKTPSVREIWLFGSRARGVGQDSDVDLAVVLMPEGKTNWARFAYEKHGDEWQNELSEIVQRHVSLEAILPDTDIGARILLWSRSS